MLAQAQRNELSASASVAPEYDGRHRPYSSRPWGPPKGARPWQTGVMWTVVLVLLAAWLILSILGLIIKGLLWLFVIGAILFVVTAVFGGVKGRTGGSSRS